MIISQPAHSKKKDTFWQTKLTNPTFTHQEFTVLNKPLFQAKLHLNSVAGAQIMLWKKSLSGLVIGIALLQLQRCRV